MINTGSDDVPRIEESSQNGGQDDLGLPEKLDAMTLNESTSNPGLHGTLESNPNCDNTVTVALSCDDEAHPLSEVNETRQDSRWQHLSKGELTSRSETELRELLQQLRSKIEDVSAELVALLQERQKLRDEVPIRNVAIAQLLKVHEQLQLSFPEPLAIQMSVIFPDRNEELDCK